MAGFIEPSARRAIIRREIKHLRKRLVAEYKPRLDAAANRAEKRRVEAQLEVAIQEAIQKAGLTPQDTDPASLY